MSEFINYFRKNSKHLEKKNSNKKTSKKETDPQKKLINEYRAEYPEIDLEVLRNLIELKEISKQPKTDKPDLAFTEIGKRLGNAEAGETLRQERWGKNVVCPFCKSTRVKRLDPKQQKSPNIYSYKCQDCDEQFNDDSATNMEGGVPPIHTWMLCWYLYGSTHSLQYIASKLGVDIGMVELMLEYMQETFRADQPLTKFLTFDEWTNLYGAKASAATQETKERKELLYRGDTSKAPLDTAEYRRQKNKAPKPKPT